MAPSATLEGVEEGRHRQGAVVPPQGDLVLVGSRFERPQGLGQPGALAPDEGGRRPARPAEEDELEEELDPEIAHVVDGLVEPCIEPPATGRRDPVDRALRTGITGLGALGRGQPVGHETVEGPVGERSA